MKNFHSASFPNKLEMAQQLSDRVKSLPKFAEQEAALIKELDKLIKDGNSNKHELDKFLAVRKRNVRHRNMRYRLDADSLMKRLTVLNKYLLGRREIALVDKQMLQQIVRNMRLATSKAVKEVAEDSVLKTESQTDYTKHNSTFGKHRADLQQIIDILANLGPVYKSHPDTISRAKLVALHTELGKCNLQVTLAKADVKKAQERRREIAQMLIENTLQIRYLIESNYKINSAAYRMIRDF